MSKFKNQFVLISAFEFLNSLRIEKGYYTVEKVCLYPYSKFKTVTQNSAVITDKAVYDTVVTLLDLIHKDRQLSSADLPCSLDTIFKSIESNELYQAFSIYENGGLIRIEFTPTIFYTEDKKAGTETFYKKDWIIGQFSGKVKL